jgi:hypothetical protein
VDEARPEAERPDVRRVAPVDELEIGADGARDGAERAVADCVEVRESDESAPI